MTWLWRAVPKSFKPNNDLMAHAAGTIFDPGKLFAGLLHNLLAAKFELLNPFRVDRHPSFTHPQGVLGELLLFFRPLRQVLQGKS